MHEPAVNTSSRPQVLLELFRLDARTRSGVLEMVAMLTSIDAAPEAHIDGLAQLLDTDAATARTIHDECLADEAGMRAARAALSRACGFAD